MPPFSLLTPRRRHLAALLVATTFVTACEPDPVPVELRGARFQLVRVNGVKVRGESATAPVAGSKSAQLECQDKVAEGLFTITDNGRAFQYRSDWRDCAGKMLVADANEGFIQGSGGKLNLHIEGGSDGGKFKGEYHDSTLVIYDLGGRLEFVKLPPAPKTP